MGRGWGSRPLLADTVVVPGAPAVPPVPVVRCHSTTLIYTVSRLVRTDAAPQPGPHADGGPLAGQGSSRSPCLQSSAGSAATANCQATEDWSGTFTLRRSDR